MQRNSRRSRALIVVLFLLTTLGGLFGSGASAPPVAADADTTYSITELAVPSDVTLQGIRGLNATGQVLVTALDGDSKTVNFYTDADGIGIHMLDITDPDGVVAVGIADDGAIGGDKGAEQPFITGPQASPPRRSSRSCPDMRRHCSRSSAPPP